MFKNIIVYTMNQTLEITTDRLKEALPTLSYKPCGKQDMATAGFVPHRKGYEELFYNANGFILLNVLKEEKILPSTVVNEFLNEKIEEYEERTGAKPKKTEKAKMKDEVIFSLLPRAFSKFNKTSLWIDTKNKLIVVDAGSSKKAEDALALLRKALGSLPVTPLTPESAPEMVMTEWVKEGQAPDNLVIGEEVELRSSIDQGVIISRNQEIPNEEILKNIESEKLVTKLALSFENKLTFTLTDELMLKKIKMGDEIETRVSEEQGDDKDEATAFDAKFFIYTEEITKLILEIKNIFISSEDTEVETEE